jgi:hypothetical protein
MSNNIDPLSAASIDRAMDTLIITVSKFNDLLVSRGLPPITQPTRHTPIEPFFADMTALIERLVPLVVDL